MNMERETSLVISRHGEVYNPDDILYYRSVNVPLNQEGHLQMFNVGRKIKERGIQPACIISSPLLRAVQSAEEIAKSFPGIQIFIEEDLQDADAPGMETRTRSWMREMEARGYDIYDCPEAVGIEPREHVAQRILTIVNSIKDRHEGETIIIVSHGDPIALLRQKLLNPQAAARSLVEVIQDGTYPEKGEAWYVVLDKDNRVIEEEIIA